MISCYIPTLKFAFSVATGHEYAWRDVKFALSLLPSHKPVQVGQWSIVYFGLFDSNIISMGGGGLRTCYHIQSTYIAFVNVVFLSTL